MQVTLAGDRVVHVEGDPQNPDSLGFLCVRGRAAKEIIHNPLRITTPMVREQRGSDNWQEISWDDAMSRIGSKLGRIAPHEFGIWMGHGDLATNYGTRLGGLLSRRFAHQYGCQWWHPAMICWGLGGFGLGLTGVLEVHTMDDLAENADLVILWGANIASQPNTATRLKQAKARGARVITIDIRRTEAAARADQSIIIKPGSDAALALAMMHVLIDEDLIDHTYVREHTIGFDELAGHVASFTPAWAASHTGVEPETIVALARQYAATTRAMIIVGGSSMHKQSDGWQGARAIACLPALCGKLGIAGGGLGPRHGGSAHGQALNNIVPDTPTACIDVIPNQMQAMTDAFIAEKSKRCCSLVRI